MYRKNIKIYKKKHQVWMNLSEDNDAKMSLVHRTIRNILMLVKTIETHLYVHWYWNKCVSDLYAVYPIHLRQNTLHNHFPSFAPTPPILPSKHHFPPRTPPPKKRNNNKNQKKMRVIKLNKQRLYRYNFVIVYMCSTKWVSCTFYRE